MPEYQSLMRIYRSKKVATLVTSDFRKVGKCVLGQV